MYKLVIFDFDGTLADSARWFAKELNPLARRFGFRQVSEAEIETLRGCDTRAVLGRLRIAPWKLPLVASHLRRRMREDAGSICLFPGAKTLLRQLAGQGVILGVASSNSAANVRAILGPEVSALVTHYACGAGLFGKAAKIRKLLRQAKVRASEAICIGDETRDIEAARQAGLACGAVAWGYATRAALVERAPNWLFDKPSEIAERLAA